MSSTGAAESELGDEEESDVFCISIYPEGLSILNGDQATVDLIKHTAQTNFPQGVKSVSETEGGGVLIKFHGGSGPSAAPAADAGNPNFLYSNAGKILCCQVLAALSGLGWSVTSTAQMDSMCIYNLPEELYPVTTWFLQRRSQGPPEEEAEEEEDDDANAI